MRQADFSRREPPYRWTMLSWDKVSRKLPWPNLWWGTRVLLALLWAGGVIVLLFAGGFAVSCLIVVAACLRYGLC